VNIGALDFLLLKKLRGRLQVLARRRERGEKKRERERTNKGRGK